MAGARILSNHGVKVEIFLSSPPEKSSKWVRKQHNILKNMDIKVVVFDGENFPKKVDLIIDGLIGYSLTGKPAGTVREMIEWANGSDALILSLDMPTGVNPDTGESEGAHINAHGTLTLALPKVGLKPPSGRKCSGELYLADIGIPPSLYEKPSLGFPVPNIFNESPIVRIY
jgi:NAD(P)H-hydrate epimerase